MLADVAERRMAKIVRQASCFHNLGVQAMILGQLGLVLGQKLTKAPADLGYFDRVLLAGVEDVRFAGSNDLRNACKPLKGR